MEVQKGLRKKNIDFQVLIVKKVMELKKERRKQL